MAKIFNRLCIHTITTKPWSIEEATEHYLAIGVKGMTVWRKQHLQDVSHLRLEKGC